MKSNTFAALMLSVVSTLFASNGYAADNQQSGCNAAGECTLESGRSYQVQLPDQWSDKDKMPLLIHFHGWGRTGKNVANNKKVAGAAKETGVVLLAPNGLGKSWSFWNTPSRDVPFVEAMIEDAAKRFPIDRERIYVSGFSYGAAMAWRLACERGAEFAGFLTMAGTLWNLEELESCAAPITLRHVHGLKDTVMDLPVGENGDPLYSVYPWVELAGCREAPDQTKQVATFNQSVWTGCTTKHDIELELHSGGHVIPKQWMKRQLERLQKEHEAR